MAKPKIYALEFWEKINLFRNSTLVPIDSSNVAKSKAAIMSDDIQAENFDEDDYKEPDVLRELIEQRELTLKEAGELLGVSQGTILRYLKKYGIAGRGVDIEVPDGMNEPWRNKSLMERIYLEEENPLQDVALALDKSQAFIRKWLEKHDIPIRSMREASWVSSQGHRHWVRIEINRYGHVDWRITVNNKERRVAVHRLLAVAKFGFEAVQGHDVHHKNGIPWDNRPENIELLSHGDHSIMSRHALSGVDRLRVAELYENGNISSRDLGDMFNVTNPTVLRIHSEFYGEEKSD